MLQECPLHTDSNIQSCIDAAKALQTALCQELGQGLGILQAVTDQSTFFSNLSSSFGKRLQEHLTSQFIHSVSVDCVGVPLMLTVIVCSNRLLR